MTYPVASRLINLAAGTSAASALVTAILVVHGTVPVVYAAHAILAAGLAVGIYRRSRICAAAAVSYWVVSKMVPVVSTPEGFGVVGVTTAMAVLGAFVGGLFATIVYHRRGLG